MANPYSLLLIPPRNNAIYFSNLVDMLFTMEQREKSSYQSTLLQLVESFHFCYLTLGLTLIDFIMLPERARISIIYNGEDGGEGFFGLKRL